MLLGRVLVALVLQHIERLNQLAARVSGTNYRVEIAALGGNVRIGEAFAELLDLGSAIGIRVWGLLDFVPIDDVYRAFRSHHRDFGRRPGVIHVGANVLGRHDAIRAAVSFARDDGHLGHGRLGKGEEQLRSVGDDAAELLLRAGQKSRDIFEGDQRDVEAVAEAHETRALDAGADVEHAGQKRRLVGDDAHGFPVQPGEADHDVPGVMLLHLEEVAVVHDGVDHVLNVVRLIGFGGDDGVQALVNAVDGIGARFARRIFEVVGRNETEQLAHHAQALGVIVGHEVRHAGALVVGHRPPELVLGDLFVGHRLDDVGPGDEHVRGFVHHQDEVGHGRRIDGAACARAHDGGDLWDDAGGQHITQEDVGVSRQRHYAFLNARAAGIVQSDNGSANTHRGVHDLHDFGSVGLRQRAAEYGEVLGEDEHQAAFDAAVAGDEAVAEILLLIHAEVGAAMGDELVGLFEGAFVEQELDALACRHLALLVLACATIFATAGVSQRVTALQFGQFLFQVHGRDYKHVFGMEAVISRFGIV